MGTRTQRPHVATGLADVESELASLSTAQRNLAAAQAQRGMAEHDRLMGEAMSLIRWAMATLVAANAGAVTATLQIGPDTLGHLIALTCFMLSACAVLTGGWLSGRSNYSEAVSVYTQMWKSAFRAEGIPLSPDIDEDTDRRTNEMDETALSWDLWAGRLGLVSLSLFVVGGLFAIWS